MAGSEFFNEPTEQSQVKAAIVSKYFSAWAKVIISSAKRRGTDRIAYIDLFAGTGRYEDGTPSTPLLVLQQAIRDPDLRKMLVTVFNDADANNVRSLQDAIASIADIALLKYKPQFYNEEVGQKIIEMFEQVHLVPTLFFVDPWGYKGLSLRLINSLLKDWGCDGIIFFNYNRVNMGLHNEVVREHMDALFGRDRAAKLRARLEEMSPHERELAIVEAIMEAMQEMGGKYVRSFAFKNDSGTRTSHHLIFVTKHIRGYEIMKGIMARESSSTQQGVPSFEYSRETCNQPMLFELSRPLDDLSGILETEFAGRSMTMLDLYQSHHVGKPFIKSNYKHVLAQLEAKGRITADPPADRRPKHKGQVTFADSVKITFPGS